MCGGLHSKGRLVVSPTNIGQGCKGLEVTNTLAFFNMELNMAVISFIIKTTENAEEKYCDKFECL